MSYTAYASSSASSTATSSSFGHAYPATIYAQAFPSNCTYYNPAQPKAGLRPLPAQTQIDYKVQLRSRLATGTLRDTPEGFPFKVENKGGKPVISVEYRGETKVFVSNLLCIYAPKLISFLVDS